MNLDYCLSYRYSCMFLDIFKEQHTEAVSNLRTKPFKCQKIISVYFQNRINYSHKSVILLLLNSYCWFRNILTI